ncbi:outer membrane protein assembly factor BamD [Desulforapulum autotrophicum]|nr:outer membrane protein assembly factor BamD [Desulforapulum autotrophicum]
MKKIAVIVLSLFVFSASGCAWFKGKHEMEKSAETLVREGSAQFRDQDYKYAIKSFTTLKDWYPFSKYAILAELKIADAHFQLEEYDEAIFAYQEFENLHPKNEAIPYVIYQTGRCWFDRIDTVDRDQRCALKAQTEFNRLVHRFPDAPESAKAAQHIEVCIKSLAGHELYVAEFYFKAKHYKAAMKRFEHLFANYPDTREGKEALPRIAVCREMIDQFGDQANGGDEK